MSDKILLRNDVQCKTSKKVGFHFHPPIHLILDSAFGHAFHQLRDIVKTFDYGYIWNLDTAFIEGKAFFPRNNDNQIMNALHFLSSIDSVKPDIILT